MIIRQPYIETATGKRHVKEIDIRLEDALVHSMLLRSMQQAIYTPINSGHFGLAFEAYTHFTSPIRRYPDLLVHRVIKAILARKRYELPNLPTPGEAHAKLSKRLASRVRPPVAGEVVKKPSADTLAWQAAGLRSVDLLESSV